MRDPILDAWLADGFDDDPNYSDHLRLVTRVRADEREAAAQRVLAVEWGWYDDTQQDETIMRSDAVNAVRGDSDDA